MAVERILLLQCVLIVIATCFQEVIYMLPNYEKAKRYFLPKIAFLILAV